MLLADPKVRRWTKSEYYQAADLGWFEGQRVELIDGEVVKMAPQKNDHAHGVTLADYAAKRIFGSQYVVRVQLPMDFGSSQPEPDVAVIRGTLKTVKTHPKTAALVIEVADTTLKYDREIKSRLYASRGVTEYWVVNLIDRQVEVRRQPGSDGASPFGYGYAETTVYQPGQAIAPLGVRKGKVKVADLLP
jgi:Uma2 family endonuclease